MDSEGVGPVSTQYLTFAAPPDELALESGERLGPITVAYETYGRADAGKTNAILICHALTGDAHAAGRLEGETKPGWWDGMIGPGRAFDTSRYFVICSNVIGSCKGSTGPNTIDPRTGKPYGLSFPVVTIADMVRVQKRLLDELGIRRLLAVAGGSMGGAQALQWAILYPETARTIIAIATSHRHSAQQIALQEVGRQAIMADPDWNNGDYYGRCVPARGLAVARMIGHITYMSERSMEEKFGRRLVGKERLGYDFSHDFQVENYLRYRGDSFVQRFDANSYLYLTKALDYFDLGQGPALRASFRGVRARFLVLSFTSDWLYPSYQSRQIVQALKANDADVSYVEINSSYGHDAFLVEIEGQSELIAHFLARAARETSTGRTKA